MLEIKNSHELTNQEGVNVYLKNCPTAFVTLPGKVVSVKTESLTLTVKTDKIDAAFNTNDVVAVVFGYHTATAAKI